MDKNFLEKLKASLTDEKNKILEELKKISFQNKEGDFEVKAPTFSDDLDIDTEADEAEEFSTFLGLEKQLEEKLISINGALLKIEKGKFGICEKCHKEIENEKLEANPATEFCIECGQD